MIDTVRPKKALGQHFLKDTDIAFRIADTLSEYKDFPTLEIGPGMGILTRFLLEQGHDLTVVELDNESVSYLTQNYKELENRIIEKDFLKLNLSELFVINSFVSLVIIHIIYPVRYFSKSSIIKTKYLVVAE